MDIRKLAIWALDGNTGSSSICMARHMIGLPTDGDYPHDGGDFGRCENLLVAVPEFRDRLHEMASVNAYWAALVPRWNDIREADDKYEIIKSITRPVEKNDPNVIRLSDGVSMSFR